MSSLTPQTLPANPVALDDYKLVAALMIVRAALFKRERAWRKRNPCRNDFPNFSYHAPGHPDWPIMLNHAIRYIKQRMMGVSCPLVSRGKGDVVSSDPVSITIEHMFASEKEFDDYVGHAFVALASPGTPIIAGEFQVVPFTQVVDNPGILGLRLLIRFQDRKAESLTRRVLGRTRSTSTSLSVAAASPPPTASTARSMSPYVPETISDSEPESSSTAAKRSATSSRSVSPQQASESTTSSASLLSSSATTSTSASTSTSSAGSLNFLAHIDPRFVWRPAQPIPVSFHAFDALIEDAVTHEQTLVDAEWWSACLAAEQDERRRAGVQALAGYSWMSEEWVRLFLAATHMFSRADPADPKFAAKAAAYTNQRVVGVGKGSVELVLQTVREDVVVAMVTELGPVINVSLIDSLFDWVERNNADDSEDKSMTTTSTTSNNITTTIASLEDLGYYMRQFLDIAHMPAHDTLAVKPVARSHDHVLHASELLDHLHARLVGLALPERLSHQVTPHFEVKKSGPRSRFSSAGTDTSLATTTSGSTDLGEYEDLPGFGKPWHAAGVAAVEHRLGELEIGVGEAAEDDGRGQQE